MKKFICPKCKKSGGLGTVGICDEDKLVQSILGKNSDTLWAITCSCGFRSKEYSVYPEMEKEFNQYVKDIK